jgi:hypothetical protein
MRIVIATVMLMSSTAIAFAACPLGTRYQCQQGFNGKVICGCR